MNNILDGIFDAATFVVMVSLAALLTGGAILVWAYVWAIWHLL